MKPTSATCGIGIRCTDGEASIVPAVSPKSETRWWKYPASNFPSEEVNERFSNQAAVAIECWHSNSADVSIFCELTRRRVLWSISGSWWIRLASPTRFSHLFRSRSLRCIGPREFFIRCSDGQAHRHLVWDVMAPPYHRTRPSFTVAFVDSGPGTRA